MCVRGIALPSNFILNKIKLAHSPLPFLVPQNLFTPSFASPPTDRPPPPPCSGRGNGIATFKGNIQFRDFVASKRDAYMKVPRMEKTRVAHSVVAMVWDVHGRFLEKHPTEDKYRLVPVAKAVVSTRSDGVVQWCLSLYQLYIILHIVLFPFLFNS